MRIFHFYLSGFLGQNRFGDFRFFCLFSFFFFGDRPFSKVIFLDPFSEVLCKIVSSLVIFFYFLKFPYFSKIACSFFFGVSQQIQLFRKYSFKLKPAKQKIFFPISEKMVSKKVFFENGNLRFILDFYKISFDILIVCD